LTHFKTINVIIPDIILPSQLPNLVGVLDGN
jgi:hypothetical protein